MEQGFLAIILHAHLPYVRHPELEDCLEEDWLAEAITESYLPLLLALEQLRAQGIDFRLTFSISPTLVSMLLDPFLQERYVARIGRLVELAEKEVERTRTDRALHDLASMYHRRFNMLREAYVNRYQGNLVQPFRKLQDAGKLEIMASAATHAYLPLIAVNPPALRTQVRVGIEYYEKVFGRKPKGFWLPECAYYPGLEGLLGEYDIRYTILETHGITRAVPRPKLGVYAPIYSQSGVAFFGRDPDSSKQVWSSTEGYPGDPDYREFYRDVAYDLSPEYMRPYLHGGNIRTDTGIKYYRVTGKTEEKQLYAPEQADQKARLHAEHFLQSREEQVRHLAAVMDRKPVVVAPYDAELFGHWWYEGPKWLDHLVRKTASGNSTVRLTTPSEYLQQYPANQVATPSASSWGNKGFNEVWLNGSNDWIYPHLHGSARLLEQVATSHSRHEGLTRRALNQAARELMLAQSSDWAFIMNAGTVVDYATRRTKTHVMRTNRLCQEIQDGQIDEPRLVRLEAQDNIFERIDTAEDFMRPSIGEPGAIAAVQDEIQAASAIHIPAPAARTSSVLSIAQDWLPSGDFHVAMITSELVPFAKTGGLADMVSSLAIALKKLGVRVSVVLPGYRSVLDQTSGLQETPIRLIVPVSKRTEEAEILKSKLDSCVDVYAVRADRYFNREQLYGTRSADYSDNAERFTFFCRAALQLLSKLDIPHVLHCHDWQSALAIVFLKTQPQHHRHLASVTTLLTVHNVGYQGIFPAEDWPLLNLDRGLFTAQHLEFYGKINFLKGGLVFADAITTVSPTYAEEIKTAEMGFGLEGVFRSRSNRVFGILNGADYDIWNPASDRFIASNYEPENLSGKSVCKADLQRAFGLPERADTALLGMVSRLAAQKGLDILHDAVPELVQGHVQLVILGTGDTYYQELFAGLPTRYPGAIGVRIGFDEALAHKVQAGADMSLVPSRYEPGGLTQLYSLKYGTIPIVRATGGLRDTVQQFDPVSGNGTGFLFGPYSSGALLAAVKKALGLFARKQEWTQLMRNAMTADFSWDRSARTYLGLYGKLLGYPKPEPAARPNA